MRRPIDYDIRAALDHAGIRWKSSGGGWVRCKAVWRDSKDDDLCINLGSGGWVDQGGDRASGGLRDLCDRLNLDRPTRKEYTPAEKEAWEAARRARDKKEQEGQSARMKGGMSIRSRAVSLDDTTNKNAAALRDFIQHRGLSVSTLMQVARAGYSMGLPCLIYGRRDPRTGAVTTIHREWDKRVWPEENGSNKRGLGPAQFLKQSVYIEYNEKKEGTGTPVVLAEGQLTAACGSELYPNSPALSFFTAGGMENPATTKIEALYDIGHHDFLILADAGKTGIDAAHACARKILLSRPDARITISAPPEGRVAGQKKGEDWLDVRAGYGGVDGIGDDATRNMIKQCAVSPAIPIKPTNNVIQMVPWEKIERHNNSNEQPLAVAEKAVLDAVKDWTDADKARATIIRVTPGVGKTHALVAAVNASDKPFLILCPTLDQARAIVAQMPDAVLHEGRNEQNCKQFPTISALTEKRRSPHAQMCMTCPHGDPDSDDPCEYMIKLPATVYRRVVVAAHGAGAEDSILYSFCEDPGESANKLIDRKIATDESPSINTQTIIDAETLALWRAGVFRGDAILDRRQEEAEKIPDDEDEKDRREREKTLGGIAEARAWLHEIAPHLDSLALALAGAPADRKFHEITGFESLATLAKHVPAHARHIDATVIEAVELRYQDSIIPLKAIETLGTALEANTAFFEAGKIICMTTASLWKQIVRRSGLLLDATPNIRQIEEIKAAGGQVVTVQAAQPTLRVTQYGPRLHGRGSLMDGGAERMADNIKRVADGAVTITHKPVADMIADPRVGHWGRHNKAHNDWKDENWLTLYGLPILSPREQYLQYIADRAALSKVGVDWSCWDGSASKNQVVEIDGWRVRSAARLPTEPQARAWLLDRLAADVAQAIGRLRAGRRTEPVTVDIYGLLPLIGHGIYIDEFKHENDGRAASTLKTRAAIAAGVIHLGEYITRKKLSDFVLRQSGRKISNTTLDCVLDEIKTAALARGITLAQACAALIATAEQLLGKHGGDAGAALQEVAGRAPATELLLWACAHEPLADEPRASQGP